MASEINQSAPASLIKDTAQSRDKPFNTLILDSGPIIKNNPPVSTLLAQCHSIVTIPEVIAEIRDVVTRARIETTLLPFLQQRSPRPDSVKFVIDFARRTGDLGVLSKTDLRIVALAYELECELNGGDWRLKRLPGQKDINGPRPASNQAEAGAGRVKAEDVAVDADTQQQFQETHSEEPLQGDGGVSLDAGVDPGADVSDATNALAKVTLDDENSQPQTTTDETIPSKEDVAATQVGAEADQKDAEPQETQQPDTDRPEGESQLPAADNEDEGDEADAAADGENDDDEDGWITPGNIHKHKARDAAPKGHVDPEPKHTKVATLTTDFAMQNVLLQINLNLVSDSLYRIRSVKTFALRCYACFQIVKDMAKQFCPRCGKPSLTRVSCSTDAQGGFQVHLKKNFKLNTRGDRYSIPKPVTGSASGRVRMGGGTGGWGADLILAEDQKEYSKAVTRQKRIKEKDLMDEDYLPNILTGARAGPSDRIKVGAGRSVNSTRRKK